MSSTEWPEFESTTSSRKALEWSLRTESELHVGRLEAKLESIKKKQNRATKHRSHDLPQTSQDLIGDPDAEEIQAGQEEADEGLWLLWDNQPSQKTSSSARSQSGIYGSNAIRGPFTEPTAFSGRRSEPDDEETQTQGQDEEEDEDEREERLELAKAQAKHAEEYMDKGRVCSRTCCIIL
ncbi:hypothetical protein BX616_010876 [Lobosporangium transversale]|uniref:Uncharacterized protein n=1 Tax=Lobosporangium transversale TaxID=64571 RepID=A0A1Y2GB37_9FUNG|nr:hypothetical protein BCR41DRAFT_389449 [Lobosporangium transversale]KAF9910368.1 hypothetical protein BX616_010876 [Lobosporangium transversale]ORZ05967.1 hypothetical protein BCR41DRAFT_389449 [Lobosporangium transversale]|eukprot:XP_021877348.1 hypothetical protein BCR41DRAFT_389449 [Lobosporangium transversale]